MVFLIRPSVLLFSEEAPPPPPPPVVYFRCTDDTLRSLVKRLRERTEILREKAIDPYATSPEISPPVSKYERAGGKQTQVRAESCLTHRRSLCPLSAYSEEGRLHPAEGRGADSERRGG